MFVPGIVPAAPTTTGGLPVVFWIHGGGCVVSSHRILLHFLTTGNRYEGGYAAEFNGADLVADSHNGVVAVVIQYRLGAFGGSLSFYIMP